MMVLLPVAVSAYDAKIGGVFYNLNSNDKTATVTYERFEEWTLDGDLMYFNSCSGDIVIPSTVTHEGVTYTVTSIESSAFCNANELTSITIPNSVTNIGDYVFTYCENLTSIVVEDGNTVYDSREGCNSIIRKSDGVLLYGCMNSTIPDGVKAINKSAFSDVRDLTSITIPNSVLSIGDYAFLQSGLTSVAIGDGVKSIGNSAFYGCSELTSLTIGKNVTSIGEEAFSNCASLTSVTIPNSVTSIGARAFFGRYVDMNLTSVTIGSNVVTIGDYAFHGCPGLKTVYCYAPVPPTYNLGIFAVNETAVLYVPTSSLSAYQNWHDFEGHELPWGGFAQTQIFPITGVDSDKVATPTITISNGVLKFDSSTSGVEYHYSINYPESNTNVEGNNVQLPQITVSVFATKTGYQRSDTATKQFNIIGGLMGDVNNDGSVDVADHVELSKIILGQ